MVVVPLQILLNNENGHVYISALKPGYRFNSPVSYVIINGTYCCHLLLSQKHLNTFQFHFAGSELRIGDRTAAMD